MLALSGVHFRYPNGGFELRIPRLEVAAGEKVAVIGPSGSGKTTLLSLVAGIACPDDGAITLDGVRVDRLGDSERRRLRITRIGQVFQTFELLDYLSVGDNILLPYRISPALKLDRAVRDRAAALADAMGIGALLRRRPDALSRGEQQRAAICRALLPRPALLLADEATGNLDPDNKTRILDLLFEPLASGDAALLAVTHDHELLPRFDRVIDFREFAR